ncbi:hypothetical protein [Kineococcus indalonis]|uniref:hypothetical protein n=1 Tax=Kineococcus indalonis TaxID=2696566 RepID=UPI001412676F|nr:hypothetical protein [Kineococcus indalonis]NAZ85037.1 hypothetical protein [Kineococcus indalonis]
MSKGGQNAVLIALIGLVGTVLAAFIGIVPSLGLFDQGPGGDGAVPGWGAVRDGSGEDSAGSDGAEPSSGSSGPASLFLSATSAPAGETFTVSGEGFDPDEVVTVRVHTSEVASTQVDGDGSFSGVAVVVPDELGVFAPHRFDVVATGESSIRSASKQITVS